MAFILDIVRKVGKPFMNVVNGLVQSLDADGTGRERVARRYGLTIPLSSTTIPIQNSTGVNYDLVGQVGVQGRGMIPLDDEATAAADALFAMEQVRNMNVLLNEIPWLGYDEFTFTVSQSYQFSVPYKASAIQTHFCSPMMNLGEKFLDLARNYRVFKVDGVALNVAFQNQNYSTQTVGYDAIVTKDNIRRLQSSLKEMWASGGSEKYATGHDLEYFSAKANETPAVPDVDAVGTLGDYLFLLDRIQKLPSAKQFGQLVPAQLGIGQPSFRLVALSDSFPSLPVQNTGTEYLSFDYADDFFDPTAQHADYMPVYGKFFFAVSNLFQQTVDVITTIEYRLTCKRRVEKVRYSPADKTSQVS